MKKPLAVLCALGALSICAYSQLGVVMTAKTSFMGDGWFAPAEGGYGFLGTGNFERGLAYNKQTDHLILVSRAGGTNVRILSGQSGADLGAMNVTGVTGGGFAVNMAGADDNGNIYVANLSTSATSPFKVYKWAGEGAVPTTDFNAVSGLARTGDTFDVYDTGSGVNYIGSGSGSAGFASIVGGVGSVINPAGAVAGDYRLGLTYMSSGTKVFGTQGNPWRYVDYSGSPTLLGSPATTSASERAMDFAVVGGYALLATIDTISSRVRIYDVTNPLAPSLRTFGTTTSGVLTANGNGTGQVKFGKIVGNKATLYAMSSNQGIQAFDVTVPEPGSMIALGAGAAFLLFRRRR